MNINEEKEHLYNMMRDITSERRQLTDMYFGLKERLDDLNKLEQRGLKDLSVKGYIDLYNKEEPELVAKNLQREMNHLAHKIMAEPRQEEEENSIIPKSVISEQRFADSNKIIKTKKTKEVKEPKESKLKIKSKKTIPYEKISDAVIEILKEKGTPVKMSDLFILLNVKFDGAIHKGNFQTNVIPRMMEDDSNLEKPYRGFYQYNPNKILDNNTNTNDNG